MRTYGCRTSSPGRCGGASRTAARTFVYESRVKEFLVATAPEVRDLRQMCPLRNNFVDCGAMVMDAQELVNDAVSKGAKLHCATHCACLFS